jgi:PPOX class probable F420-dependent enzyme
MDIAAALTFARSTHNSVLTTIKRDGRPQLSNVTHGVGEDDVIRVSVTADRAKYLNLRRDPRASLYMTQPDFMAYVVIESDVSLAPVAADPGDATVEELVAFYRSVQGEHPNWDEYRQAMVRDRRTIVRITPTHVYGYLGS